MELASMGVYQNSSGIEKTRLLVLRLALIFTVFVCADAKSDNVDFSDQYDRVFQIRSISNNTNAKASIGSGFQVSKDGLIITNYHVVSQYITSPNAYSIEYAAQNGTTGTLELLDFDIISDLAVLRHPAPAEEFFELADDIPGRGAITYALGNPGDWGMVMVPGPTNGFVEHSYEKRLLFSGSLNSGMSGGPSLNREQKVVGVNVATAGSQLSFLVPVDKVRALIANDREIHPSEFDNEIAAQLIAWQRPRLQELIDKPWEKTSLLGRNFFNEIRSDFQCWGGSNDDDPDRTVNISSKRCSSGDEIYINSEVDAGIIRYGFFHRSPKTLNNMQFALWQGMESESDNYSDYYTSTNYICESDFLHQSESNESSYTRMITCIRAYRKYPGLFDSLVLILNQKDEISVKTRLTISAAEKDQILALNKKFAEAVQ